MVRKQNRKTNRQTDTGPDIYKSNVLTSKITNGLHLVWSEMEKEMLSTKDDWLFDCHLGNVRPRNSLTNWAVPVFTGRLGSLVPALTSDFGAPRRLRTTRSVTEE